MRCPECGTELAPRVLACPHCGVLRHGPRLKLLAAKAEDAERAGRLAEARAVWEETLTLLPADSHQHRTIAARLAGLAAQATELREAADDAAHAARAAQPWYKRIGGGLVAVLVLLLSKAKFLLLGLSKLPTLISAFGFFGLYWAAFGWPLALGLVLGIYVHEMGHVAALVRLGIRPSAPMFIPGFGAFVSYSKRITDPREDAIVGLAGPIWGAGFGLVAFALAEWYGNATLLAVAQLTGWLNLFNLLPFFGLDGSHGFPPLSRPQQVVVVGAMVLGAWLTAVPILWLVAIAGGVRLFVGGAGTGDARTLANFLGLLAVLAWMAQLKAL